MSEITVKEISLSRKALERDIQERIASFESITGCAVTRMHVIRKGIWSMAPPPIRKSVLMGTEISIS